MLAGFLPFDDDPNNPDGANIPQLYRHITSTPLNFPKASSIWSLDVKAMLGGGANDQGRVHEDDCDREGRATENERA